MERLQKYMAHAGIASRRKSEDIIQQGRVKVNGRSVTSPGTKIDPVKDEVEVDGEVITREEKVYIILNKPTGYVTTVSDPHNRKTVLDLIENLEQRIYPVGRLDYDSSGLLLLTNDGQLTYKLTHPSHEIEKTYRVTVRSRIKDLELKKLEKGVKLEDGLTAPARVKLLSRREQKTVFNITIHEGRNRQIRRMTKYLGYEVQELKRIAIGNLQLNNLKEGEYRFLTKNRLRKFNLL